MKKHYREIDILKGLAIAMVMLGHSIIVYPIDLNLIRWCGSLHSFVSTTHMPLFFMISGFCFGYRDLKDYALKKFKRIVIPLLVFGVLHVFLGSIGGDLVNRGGGFLQSLPGVLTGKYLWFLHALLMIFIIFPFIRKLFDNKLVGAIALIALAALNIFVKFPLKVRMDALNIAFTVPNTFSLDSIREYLFFFAAGYYLKLRSREYPEVFKKSLKAVGTLPVWLVSLAVWFVIAFPNMIFGLPYASSWQPVLRGVYGIFVAFMGILCVTSFAILIRRFFFSKLFEEAGKYSLQIFLFNGYLLTVTRWLVVSKLHIKIPAVIIAANFFVLFGVSLVIIELVVKRVKLFRILTGIPEPKE
ncbi:MAG: acyltransferase [Clostridia bacterium]|nr:acyltransferase [Clostridia bacterium]